MKRMFPSLTLSSLLAAVLLGGSIAPVLANDGDQKLAFHWVNLQPENGLIVDGVVLFFHDGSFDLYKPGEAASPLLKKLTKGEFTGLEALAPGVKIHVMNNPHEPSPVAGPWNDLTSVRWDTFNSKQHRYATAYIALRPSNDAFIGNDDSYRIRLFDLDGNSETPVVVDFTGDDVMDAGLCTNDEAKLHFLDVKEMTTQTCVAENGVVRRHSGFNGSARNPNATPKRILGGTSVDMGGITGVRQYDTVNSDFSRGGIEIGRLVFMRLGSLSSATGSWYSPTRAGEGFNVEVFRQEGTDAEVSLIYWYTFEPATGRPLWLTGSGDLQAGIVLHSASGGSINSPTNPVDVVRKRWGTLRLPFENREFDWCGNGLTMDYVPDDSAVPAGKYFVERLTPRGDAAEALCKKLYPPTRHVH